MEPPPRSGPPGASSGPPPSGPNMFRRTRPHKHTSAVPPATQPMTDPFAFGRAPTPMATGGLPTIPNSNPPPMLPPPGNFFSPSGSGQPPQPLYNVPSTSTGSTAPSLPGVTQFNPSNTGPPGFVSVAGPPAFTPTYTEQSYFNSREPTPSTVSDPPHEAPSVPASNETTNNQEFQGPPPLSFQPVPPVTSSSQWAPDHGSRPPSVQNYFQPTSDPPTQPMHMQPYSQIFPPHTQSPQHHTHTPPTLSGPPSVQASGQHLGKPQYIEANTPQQHNTHPPMQNYFSQSTNLSPLDSGYHQMGSMLSEAQPPSDSSSLSASSAGPRPASAHIPHVQSQESSTLSMFFKDDVENKETLTGEANKAVNGVTEALPYSGHADAVFDFHGTPLQPPPQMPYMNEESTAQGNDHKPTESHYDHVENLECVPNQEVLPTERHTSPVSIASHVLDQFETGPNLETPDSAPRPMRSASVSSNYSNLSHGSGTGSRRHQGIVGTFIQQESSRLPDDVNQSATGGYFEQIDSSSTVEGTAQNATENNWLPTPSPPKPVGIFQASANSSFEPVRSHSVGVRPAEVDRANMVAEGGADSTPGNLEQPPDNMENIYCLGPPLPTESSGSLSHATHPVVHAHSRPSSRAYGVSRPCESPATTLWAQNDPSSLGTNILLVPAAPTVLAPLREPSGDVIQPPEDGPLDLHGSPQSVPSASNQLSENLENPPKVSEAEPADTQGNLGYASLLVSDSLHQPILIAPPVSNYTVIPASIQTQAGGQLPSKSSNQNPLFSSSFNQSPLNLTREKTELTPEMTAQPPPVRPPLSRGQSVSGESQSSVCIHSQASRVAPVSISNHNAPTNYELLDFSMHQSQTQNQTSGHSSSLHDSQQCSNGFYLQVTKDLQQSVKAESNASVPTSGPSSSRPLAPSNPEPSIQQPTPEPTKSTASQSTLQSHTSAPPVAEAEAQSSGSMQAPVSAPPPAYPPGPHQPVSQSPGPTGGSQPLSGPPRPPSTAGSQQGYGPPAAVPPGVPGPGYRGYYSGNYGDYSDNRFYLPGQYPPPVADTRSQYYPEDPYRNRTDPWYGRYDGVTQAAYCDQNYQYREPQPERPSSRTSQYSDRPSSRQGYLEEYRANRNAYNDYYQDYSNQYNYAGYNYGGFDPRYRGYYWSGEGYRNREAHYNQQMCPPRKNGYDDQWRYYPGYDPSFDDDYQWRGDAYNDDFDRRSVHSEHSAHSGHSAHSHHSRQSSFSSHSQQSQVYQSQTDLVSAAFDHTSSTLAVDYSYGQYPNQTGTTQNYSQYPYTSEYPTESTWIAPEQPPPRPATPEKFTMPHRCARFGPGGHMVQVLPNLPSAGQPALVDIHNLETMLQDTSAQAELRAFPGPLVKEDTHKVDVIKFSQNKALECSRDNNLLDRDSARLLWDFIVLLCRQNGTVVGTDIADLLLKEHRSVWLPGKSPNEANLIDFNNEPLSQAEEEPGAGPLSLLSDTFMTVPENLGKETERFRELLLFGRKKDALEAAMKSGLWGHALLLASKMDSRTHARVMTRFANSLPINDPLQTVYQLMSGRMPASATCCGEEKWGDWRPHLAMVLSNLTHTLDLDTRTIATMGDTLASKGLIDAAHFCYLMAQVGLGVYTKKSTKMVLIGSNHSLSFYLFASNDAIQRTEAYEYAQSLGSHSCSLPNFQVYKFIYACRLAEAGLSAQAFHYCEVISKTVLMQPSYYSPIFLNQLIQMSEKLRFFDPQLKEKPEQELFKEPEWLIHLRQLDGQMRTGMITYNADRSTPAQYDCSCPSSDLDEPSPTEPYNMPGEFDGNTPDNPLMSSLLPGSAAQGVQLMPPAPTSILQESMAPPQLLPPNDVPQFYPVPPTGPQGQIPYPGYAPHDPGYAPPQFPSQSEQVDLYPGGPTHMSPVPTHINTAMPPPSVQMNPPNAQMPPSPGHLQPVEHVQGPPLVQPGPTMSASPPRSSLTPQMDFYDQMVQMGPGRRSRTTSQSSMHMPSGRRSRTTSESSTHSIGRERSNSAIKQVSPPPPPIPEQPRKEEKKAKKDSPKKSSGRGWLDWIYRKGKNEAHLPDDKNKSIVWDEKKQRWVDLNEPEEETKPPPPPPSGFPSMPSMPGPAASMSPPSGGPPVNMFSRKAGTKSRYVDVLNPSRTVNKSGGSVPAPADIFAPLAPMTMPANLFVPSSAPDDQQPLEGSEGGNQEQNSPNASTIPQMFNPTLVPPAPEIPSVPDGSTSGEGHPPPGPMATGGVPFYNPAQFAQPSAPSGGGLRSGRLGGQRQYPVMK
ncbi:protein transport protein Sec16A isoform X2 [Periophthalmus magnuspinnatus]|uniref:protein transport protein Sec16A isoform X2 n=1 Tax=Periophthalmus magnuspinnatus TaxID=409849 RepID=UPI00145A0FFE|nr:protein transport protein Sec16A isoform X2 [Periophthalmus magnuspinnatus]XP_055087867.1 protein transport protein Sec16A isoform X2 [Periophthalmus magnuspinnatus]